MTAPLRIAALCGSLRDASYNRAMLHAAADLAPDGMDVEVYRLNDIPLFNEEVEAKGWPEDGLAPGTRWEDIPEDWSCPDCGAAKSDFEMVEVARP